MMTTVTSAAWAGRLRYELIQGRTAHDPYLPKRPYTERCEILVHSSKVYEVEFAENLTSDAKQPSFDAL